MHETKVIFFRQELSFSALGAFFHLAPIFFVVLNAPQQRHFIFKIYRLGILRFLLLQVIDTNSLYDFCLIYYDIHLVYTIHFDTLINYLNFSHKIRINFTIVTLITMLISLFFIIRSFTGLTSGSTVTASHILLDGDMAKDKLVAMKKEIKQDYNQFMALAKQHSKCPSGKSAGGKLGTFTPGQM